MKTADTYKAFTADSDLELEKLAVWALAPVFVSLAPVFVTEPWLAPKRLIHRLYRDSLLFTVR